MGNRLYDAVVETPIIAAVKDQSSLDVCLRNDNIQVVFLLFGDVLTIGSYVDRIQQSGKIAIVHIDILNGLQCARDISVDFVKNATHADGIITTHPNCIRRAKELGLYTVLRVFMLDSMALANIPKQTAYDPDFIEILPGILPKVIEKVSQMTDVPLLAGGLVAEKDDVLSALHAGATGVSASSEKVWDF